MRYILFLQLAILVQVNSSGFMYHNVEKTVFKLSLIFYMLSHFCPLKHFNFLQSNYIYVNSCNLKVWHFLCNEKAILGRMQYKYKTLMNILFLLNNNDTFVTKKCHK